MPLTHSPVWCISSAVQDDFVGLLLTRHVAESTAGVASLASTTAAATVAATERTARVRTAGLGAVAGNVTNLAALELVSP
jgi:hypothetical protein